MFFVLYFTINFLTDGLRIVYLIKNYLIILIFLGNNVVEETKQDQNINE